MRKTRCLLIALISFMPLWAWGDNYSQLWKQVEEAKSKDLPRTEISLLNKIIEQAEHSGNYGHLLKAQLMRISVRSYVAPDSLSFDIERLKNKEAEAVKKEHWVLAAIYESALGRIYKETPLLDDNSDQLSLQWYAKSMSHSAQLAQQKATSWHPAVVDGEDSRIFNDDLLHVIGMEANDYHSLDSFYSSQGNRAAACICALRHLQALRNQGNDSFRQSHYTASLDSLMQVYTDIPEAGEVAIERYNFLKDSKERTDFIHSALQKWGSWPRMNQLRNALSQLSNPRFNATIKTQQQLPDKDITVYFNNVTHLKAITVTVRRVLLDGDTQLMTGRNDKEILAKVDPSMKPIEATATFKGEPAYQSYSDSLVLKGLPVGTYLLTCTADNNGVKPEHKLLFVSNLHLFLQQLPGKKCRIAVLNATTGKPVQGATVRVTTDNGQHFTKVNTDSKGEVTMKLNAYRSTNIYAFTSTDKSLREFSLYSYFYYNKARTNQKEARLYTDRSIYRPGQTVHVAAILYNNAGNEQLTVCPGRNLTLTLYDANSKKVGSKELTTDDFGTAAADFVLPSSGLTGRFSVSCSENNGYTSFRVEEYKRPTYQVEFEPVKAKYAPGDTLTLHGKAITYTSMPLQDAKVSYNIKRRPALWWPYSYRKSALKQMAAGATVTDREGRFSVNVPLTLPEAENGKSMFYSFEITATVTDAAGESHDGTTSLPVGNRPTVLISNIPARSLNDSLRSVTFSYRNSSGEAIPGRVAFSVDGHKMEAEANASVPLKGLKPGKHELIAICGTDTLRTHFVTFSLKDNRPVETTHDWFYLSSNSFRTDGAPVYLQVGSSDKDQHVIYTLISGDRVVESGSFVVSNSINTRKFTYKEDYGDGLLLNYAWVRDGVEYTQSAVIKKALPDKNLKLKWITFRDKLVPGQQEEWRLNISRPDGKPATAQLLATLYDKSLDAIMPNRWSLSPYMALSLPYTHWRGMMSPRLYFYQAHSQKLLPVRELSFSHFDDVMFLGPAEQKVFITGAATRPMLMSKAADVTVRGYGMATGNNKKVFDVVESLAEAAITKTEDSSEEKQTHAVQLRENLNETAFFFPALLTDADGSVSLKFTLPESVTTWHFMGLAHDKEVNHGLLEADAVASKTVMVQPNLPRFLRQGDEGTIILRLANSSDKTVSGKSTLELSDAATGKSIFKETKDFTVDAKQTIPVSFSVMTRDWPEMLVVRATAEGDGFSDGEQHYLPVIPNVEMVTNTYPFTQNQPGTLNIDLRKLTPAGGKQQRLTIEYTNNPAWLMVQALPSVALTNEHNAVSLAAAYYANSISHYLLNQSPAIKKTIAQWKAEKGTETSMMSNLEKNQELKTMVLSETPWLAEANDEASQKKQLIDFFDEQAVSSRLTGCLEKLRILQNTDGSFSWWPEMPGSLYMTTDVVKTLVRLNKLVGSQSSTAGIITRCFSYLDMQIAKECAELRKLEKKGYRHLTPSETACDYLYTSALAGRSRTNDINYLVNLLAKAPTKLTIYGKANSAVILAQYGQKARANEYLQSLKEYTVFKEETGRYFDTPKAQYSWFDYRIPTQTYAIEALKLLQPNDTTTISEMQRWLLQEKRTQAWSTPVNTVNAVYAFLAGNTRQLSPQQPARISLDGNELSMPEATAGLGYVKKTMADNTANRLTFEKTSRGTSWGTAYIQALQPASKVADAAAGISISREVISSGEPKVGDKIKVRITITADRDYDFVQVQDKRAACLEPVEQTSGYRWGYYVTPRDNVTNYYFDRLAKGKHVVETEYYVDRSGSYTSGICTAQCAYSPEYGGRQGALQMNVK